MPSTLQFAPAAMARATKASGRRRIPRLALSSCLSPPGYPTRCSPAGPGRTSPDAAAGMSALPRRPARGDSLSGAEEVVGDVLFSLVAEERDDVLQVWVPRSQLTAPRPGARRNSGPR